MNYRHDNVCVRLIDLIETQIENNFSSQQTKCNHSKRQNDCSIINYLQISNIVEANIESSYYCFNEVFDNKYLRKHEGKIEVPRHILRILNLSEEKEDTKTIENEEDKLHKKAAIDTHHTHSIYTYT